LDYIRLFKFFVNNLRKSFARILIKSGIIGFVFPFVYKIYSGIIFAQDAFNKNYNDFNNNYKDDLNKVDSEKIRLK